MRLPIFLCVPAFEVGKPVFLAKTCFAAVIPKARFQENEKPYFLIFAILVIVDSLDFQENFLILIEDSTREYAQ